MFILYGGATPFSGEFFHNHFGSEVGRKRTLNAFKDAIPSWLYPAVPVSFWTTTAVLSGHFNGAGDVATAAGSLALGAAAVRLFRLSMRQKPSGGAAYTGFFTEMENFKQTLVELGGAGVLAALSFIVATKMWPNDEAFSATISTFLNLG